ncbi:MAG: GHMP kinase [Candidatus Cloacimonetes bacterium]|nr:GHMP kinase [Candidatus Cloacimonadota bacterium]
MITVSAPGRICLFGEHQDYLGLPVIPMAINLRVTIKCKPRKDRIFHLLLPDIGREIKLVFTDNKEFIYNNEINYFKSIYNVLYRQGVRFLQGYDCLVTSEIPINSGTSSSSALNNVWCRFLLETGENVPESWKQPEAVGRFSYEAEVVEFSEAGGMMDQLSTAVGNLAYIDFADDNRLEFLPARLGTFVLGDSQEPKDTQKILSQTKIPALSAAHKANFDYTQIDHKYLDEFKSALTQKEYTISRAMIKNRDITREAVKLLKADDIDHKKIGALFNEHQYILDKYLGISTPKINRMLEAANEAGAYGGKINGSGGGGCMFAYAPEYPQKVAAAIEQAGGKAYIIKMDKGITVKLRSIRNLAEVCD